jgi:hypothetical protein
MTIKSIYTPPRQEGISREEFVQRWRRHGALAMAQPDFWDPVVRYMQSDRLQDLSAFPGASEAFEGVGEIYYSDVDGRTRSKQSTALREIIHPDATEFFRRQDLVSIGVEEVFVLRGRYAPVKLFGFVSRPPETPRSIFLGEWERIHTRVLAESRSAHLVRRLVRGRALEGSEGVDATVECSFDSVDDAAAFYSDWSTCIRTDAQERGYYDRLVIFPAFVSLFYDRRYYR